MAPRRKVEHMYCERTEQLPVWHDYSKVNAEVGNSSGQLSYAPDIRGCICYCHPLVHRSVWVTHLRGFVQNSYQQKHHSTYNRDEQPWHRARARLASLAHLKVAWGRLGFAQRTPIPCAACRTNAIDASTGERARNATLRGVSEACTVWTNNTVDLTSRPKR